MREHLDRVNAGLALEDIHLKSPVTPTKPAKKGWLR